MSEDTVRTPDSIVDDEDESPTRAELLELVEKMQHDWVQLNEFLNRTAIYYSWCSDWEERLNRYNYDFKVLKLQGRSDHSGRRTESDQYLLPSLKRLVPQDQAVAADDEKKIHRMDQIRERERALEIREEVVHERERELRYRTRELERPDQPERPTTTIRARLGEPRSAFTPPIWVEDEHDDD